MGYSIPALVLEVMPVSRIDSDLEDSSLEETFGGEDVSVSRLDPFREKYNKFATTANLALNDWRTKAGSLVLLTYILMGTVGVWVIDQPSMAGPKWAPPMRSLEYPLGTNQFGQSLLSVSVHATPAMFKMMLGGAGFAVGVGVLVGVVAGYKGGFVDEVLMTATDIAMTIPGLPLIIVVAAILEPNDPFLVGILVSINDWSGRARGLRSQVLTIREENYVEASRLMNVSTPTILMKDVIPPLLPLILVGAVGSSRRVIFNAVALYFLGVLPFETTNWGVMLNMGYQSGGVTTPSLFYIVLVPILLIVFLSWSLIMLAQGLDRVVNPRARARHEGTEVE